MIFSIDLGTGLPLSCCDLCERRFTSPDEAVAIWQPGVDAQQTTLSGDAWISPATLLHRGACRDRYMKSLARMDPPSRAFERSLAAILRDWGGKPRPWAKLRALWRRRKLPKPDVQEKAKPPMPGPIIVPCHVCGRPMPPGSPARASQDERDSSTRPLLRLVPKRPKEAPIECS